MIYIIIFLGLLFAAIGLTVNESNAKYFLSGYNTMPEKDRKKVDISRYIPYFRKFHLSLGLTTIVLGAIIVVLFSIEASGAFIGLYPIVAYIVFLWNSPKYSGTARSTSVWVGIGLLIACFIFVGSLLIYEFSKLI